MGLAFNANRHSLTFINNHDTAIIHKSEFYLDEDSTLAAYAFILTHPGIPSIYWEDLFDY